MAMDIYAKYIGIKPAPINGIVNDGRPFFMTDEEVYEMDLYYKYHGEDGICWESNIINQINENKYGWFDFSKNLIDIGAGAGEYPIFTKFAHSYAFEPNKRKQCLIYANMLSFDKLNDIDVLPYAISDSPGIRKFNGWSEDIKQFNNTKSEEGIYDIEYRTLDSFNFTNVGLIKADIEGFELFAFRSGIGTIIRNNYPPLLIELWLDNDINIYFEGDDVQMYKERRDTLIQMLVDLGYVLINDPSLGDWETRFFIHKTQLNGYKYEEASE